MMEIEEAHDEANAIRTIAQVTHVEKEVSLANPKAGQYEVALGELENILGRAPELAEPLYNFANAWVTMEDTIGTSTSEALVAEFSKEAHNVGFVDSLILSGILTKRRLAGLSRSITHELPTWKRRIENDQEAEECVDEVVATGVTFISESHGSLARLLISLLR